MQEQLLDFATDDTHTGFRLQRLEVFNWGTFHNRVWSLQLDGDNGLLTGDIGSGKSTLVDAMTTLLVPAQRIAYNKAAGAETKERSLRSYVQGYYKSERADAGHSARPVALRDHNSYSVILAVFRNQGYDQDITLAQVFWHKDRQGQPSRFYLVAEGALCIQQHFAGFGRDLKQLRKRLRDDPHLQLFDSFPPYEAAFRRYFGIENDQALELFHQTVSMKSVGNLTDFVREHMLEAFNVAPRIDGLIHHFDDLSRAHEAVLKARQQVEALTPLVADCRQHGEVASERQHKEALRDALNPWFAHLKAGLLAQRLERLATEEDRQHRKLERGRAQLAEQRDERDRLRESIARQGGERLEQLKSEIQQQEQQRRRRQQTAERYATLAETLDLPAQPDLDTFGDSLRQLKYRREQLAERESALDNERTELMVTMRGHRDSHDELTEEIDSLKQRRSNIHSRQIEIRRALCEVLAVDEDDLPFAGELVRVREEAAAWEGAAERVLHNFALSLLVPDRHYAEVSRWVDETHLRGRLVYYRIRHPKAQQPPDLHPHSLVHKLELKPDSEFYPWLEQELGRRFDYACCDNLDQFRREARAITAAGQIKAGDQRHEKDDRQRLDDRSRYVLGWSNRAKIEALENRRAGLEREMQALADRIAGLERERGELAQQRDALVALLEIRDFEAIDWHSCARTRARLEEEKQALEAASDQLQALNRQLQTLEQRIRESEDQVETLNRELAVTGSKQEAAQEQLAEARATLTQHPEAADLFPALEELRPEALGDRQLTVESCPNREQEMREWLQSRINSQSKKLQRLEEKILKAMADYNHHWPLDTQEVDANLAATPEYEAMLAQLQADDLLRGQVQKPAQREHHPGSGGLPVPAQQGAPADPRAHRADQPLAGGYRVQPGALYRARGPAQ